MNKIEELRAHALTCRASIYNEDAMTAIELAGCTAKKVNEVIDLINEMLDLLESLDVIPNTYNEDSETLVV